LACRGLSTAHLSCSASAIRIYRVRRIGCYNFFEIFKNTILFLKLLKNRNIKKKIVRSCVCDARGKSKSISHLSTDLLWAASMYFFHSLSLWEIDIAEYTQIIALINPDILKKLPNVGGSRGPYWSPVFADASHHQHSSSIATKGT
jgi:hypothetical protein